MQPRFWPDKLKQTRNCCNSREFKQITTAGATTAATFMTERSGESMSWWSAIF